MDVQLLEMPHVFQTPHNSSDSCLPSHFNMNMKSPSLSHFRSIIHLLPHSLPCPCPSCCCPAADPATVSSPNTLLAAINLSALSLALDPLLSIPHPATPEEESARTHSPPCHPPSPRTHSACTLVMRSRFSRSARLAASCASCACRCDCASVSESVGQSVSAHSGVCTTARRGGEGRGGGSR